jgi:hypothetical protein
MEVLFNGCPTLVAFFATAWDFRLSMEPAALEWIKPFSPGILILILYQGADALPDRAVL